MKNNNFKLLIIVILIFIVLSLPSLTEGAGASFYLSPASGTFFVGSTFDVSVFINTENNSINAVQVDLKFSPDKIQVVSPTGGSSFISVWADQPFFSNKDGLISFKGGVPMPGINTSSGLVSTITFRAKAPGRAAISFLDSSKILLADGEGTDILKTTMVGEYFLTIPPPEGPKITSPTHPSLTVWYRDNNPAFFWDKEEGVTDFSYSLDQDPVGVPDNISEGDKSSTAFDSVGDGIWYLHVKAKKNDVWGKTSHYPLNIDATAPQEFKVDIDTISKLSGSRFFAYFTTTDLLSGVNYYEISVVDVSDPKAGTNPFFIETVSPYKVPYESVGKYLVLVRAYDRAGNYRQAQSPLTIFTPFVSFTEKGIILGGFLLPWWLIYAIIILLVIFISFGAYSLLKRRDLVKILKKEVREAEKEIEDVKKLEKRIREMKELEEKTKKEEERLIEKLKGSLDHYPEHKDSYE